MQVEKILDNLEKSCSQLSKVIDQNLTKDKSTTSPVYSTEIERQAKIIDQQKKNHKMAVKVIDKLILRLSNINKNING